MERTEVGTNNVTPIQKGSTSQPDDLTKQFEKLAIKEPAVQELKEATEQMVADVRKIIQFLRKDRPLSQPYFTINHDQKSDQWLEERSIRLTGSNFKKFVRSRPDTRLMMAYQNISGEKRFFTNQAMEYGNQNEHLARDHYQSLHPDVVIKESTLTIRTEEPWLGASPDGLVLSKDGKLIGAIQIKCPFSKRSMTVDKAIDTTNFYLRREAGKVVMDQNHDYYYQIQGQMFVLNLDWIDFVVRTDIDVLVVRINRNQPFIDNIRRELRRLYFQNYVWEVIKHYIRPEYLRQETVYFMKAQTCERLISEVDRLSE